MNEEKFNEKYVTVICFNQFHGKKIFRGTMSSGRVYDKIDDENAYAIVKFISHQNVIAKIIEEDELAELRKDPENDVNFI